MLKKKEVVWRHILTEALERRRLSFTQLELSKRFGFSLEKYRELASKFSLEKFENELENEVLLFNSKDADYLGMALNEFAGWRRSFLKKLKLPAR